MNLLLALAQSALVVMIAAGVTVWTAGAIYYDVCRGGRCARPVTLVWLIGVTMVFAVWRPLWQPLTALILILGLFLVWWFRQKPSLDRDWEPSVAVLPRAVRQGDVVTIENIRNFDYRTLQDYTPRYENRTYDLTNLRGADIILFNWGSKWMSHPVLVFDFGPDGRICISIEVRYTRGQKYSILRSLYRQQELIFLAADERDAILRRTKYDGTQSAHLYRFTVGRDVVLKAFLDYVAAINYLSKTPVWYHGLCTNCTTTFYRLPSSRRRFDWRILANAYLDRALYDSGRIDQSIPFADIRRASYLNDIANRAPEAGFGDFIRSELERRRHER